MTVPFLRLSRVLLFSNRIPFILCGSRFSPATIHSRSTSVDGRKMLKFPELSSLPTSQESSAGSNSTHKVDRKQAFDALACWCGYHQRQFMQGQLPAEEPTAGSGLDTSLAEVNSAALQWLQQSTSQLTCGQSLLVCSFVCEVLYCLLNRCSSVMEVEQGLRPQIESLTNRIAALLRRVDESNKLESQPLCVLMSCAYGAHRLKYIETTQFGEAERTLVKVPPSIMLAVLHKLRGDGLVKLFQLDEETAINVCLSFLLIASEDHRQSFFTNGDVTPVNYVLRRLVRHTVQQTRKVRNQTDVGISASYDASTHHEGQLESASPPSGDKVGFTSPSIRECAVIMQNVSFCSASNRLELLLYLLCVRQNPLYFSSDELRLVPTVLDTVANIRSAEACTIRQKIISSLRLPENDPALAAQLFAHSGGSASSYLKYLHKVAVNEVSPTDAVQVIQCAGARLPFESLQLYITAALRDSAPNFSLFTPVAWHPNVNTMARQSAVVKIAPCGALDAVLSTLLARLDSGGDGVGEAEKHTNKEYIRQLSELIDWTTAAPIPCPKLALKRLTLLTKLSQYGMAVDASNTVVELALNSLQLDPGNTMVNTLRSVIEALPLVSRDNHHRIVEKMLSYSGTRTTSSVVRFLMFLSPLVDANSPHNAELVEQMLKLHTLDPQKLRYGSVGCVGGATDMYTLVVLNGIEFLLTCGDWRTSASQLQGAITSWMKDYISYVMDPARRRGSEGEIGPPTASEEEGTKIDVEARKPQPPAAEPSERGSMSGPTDEQLEQILTYLLRAGVKLPHTFAGELLSRIHSMRSKLCSREGAGDKGTFLPPAHFVFCCKLDIPMEWPVTSELMQHHLDVCDYRVIHCVIAAFFTATKAVKPNIRDLLLSNVRLASCCFENFIRRLERLSAETTESFHPTTVSSAVANTLRFIVNYITKQERCQRILQQLNEKKPGCVQDEELEGNKLLVNECAHLGELLTQIIAYLSDVHVKNVGLFLLDRLLLLSPACAECVMLRLSAQLNEFSHVELLYLAQKYPQSQEVVMDLLGKSDIASSVDLGDYTRIIQNLPMQINSLVINAHLPKLSFQWCTRLLSSLSLRHESVPLPLLTSMLERLNEIVESATPTDRNVALVVLQKYLQSDASLIDDGEQRERRRLIQRSYDCLLVLSRIDSLHALKEFLTEFPEALSGVVSQSLDEHLVRHVVGGLLKDLDGLLMLCRLLQRHKLLCDGVRLAIIEGFFMGTLQGGGGHRIAEGQGGEEHLPLDSSGILQSEPIYSLPNVLALTLLLCGDGVQSPRVSDGVGTDCNGDECRIVRRLLQVVRRLYTSSQDQLLIVSTLVGHKGSSALSAVATEVCAELIKNCENLTSNDFARLLQHISRLRCWSHMDLDNCRFDEVFQRSCTRADAHSRCVAFKAVSFEADMFRRYESFMIPLLQDVVDVMSNEDLETVLSSLLSLPFTEALESLIDSIGTRLLRMLDHCRRSALIRLLQCHAVFGIQDDALVNTCVNALADQCGRDTRLDTAQVLALLQAAVDLDIFLPPKLATNCFMWLEHHVENMTITQLGHAVRLAVDVEVGYTAAVHTLTLRALEQRDAIRSNASFREAVEMLCDEFSAEIPWHLRAPVLRRRYKFERLSEYLEKQGGTAVSSATA